MNLPEQLAAVVRAAQGGAFAEEMVAWNAQTGDQIDEESYRIARAFVEKAEGILGERLLDRFAAFDLMTIEENVRTGYWPVRDDVGEWVANFQDALTAFFNEVLP